MNNQQNDHFSLIPVNPKLFRVENNKQLPELFFDPSQLEFVNEHKHLGIILSSKLCWSNYIDEIVKRK